MGQIKFQRKKKITTKLLNLLTSTACLELLLTPHSPKLSAPDLSACLQPFPLAGSLHMLFPLPEIIFPPFLG